MPSLLRFLPTTRRQASESSDDTVPAIPSEQVDVKQEKSDDSDSEELLSQEEGAYCVCLGRVCEC